MLRSQTKAGLDAVNSEKAHYYKAKPNEEMEVEQKRGCGPNAMDASLMF